MKENHDREIEDAAGRRSRRNLKKNKKAVPLAVRLISVTVLALLSIFFAARYVADGRVELDGQPVSLMSRQDVAAYLEKSERAVADKSFMLTAAGIAEELPFSRLDAHVDKERIYDELYLVGRHGGPAERVAEVFEVLVYGRNVPVRLTANEEKLMQALTAVHEKYNITPVNAYAELAADGTVTLHAEREGAVIDTGAARDRIREKLAGGEAGQVDLPVSERREAAVKKADFAGIDTLLSSYTTHFDGSDTNRSENIGIAARLLNHTLVKAGAACSFNDTVGTRTRDKGYKDAPVYFDNKLAMDAGGGVCQVSTTLFNAVLRAGLRIDSRSPHFAPAGYVPVGMDATVADNSLDFIFSNPFTHGVYICTECTHDAITVYILGDHEDGCSVAFVTTEQKTLPHNVIKKHDPFITEDKKEQEGYDGREITIKRDVYYKDGSVYTDFIESRYEPNDDITLTCGGDSCYSAPPGAADGVHNQDEMTNKRYDPLGP